MKKFILISFVSLIFISCSMEQTSENPEGYDGESIFVELCRVKLVQTIQLRICKK